MKVGRRGEVSTGRGCTTRDAPGAEGRSGMRRRVQHPPQYHSSISWPPSFPLVPCCQGCPCSSQPSTHTSRRAAPAQEQLPFTHVAPAGLVRQRDVDELVQPPWPQQRGVDDVRPGRGAGGWACGVVVRGGGREGGCVHALAGKTGGGRGGGRRSGTSVMDFLPGLCVVKDVAGA